MSSKQNTQRTFEQASRLATLANQQPASVIKDRLGRIIANASLRNGTRHYSEDEQKLARYWLSQVNSMGLSDESGCVPCDDDC